MEVVLAVVVPVVVVPRSNPLTARHGQSHHSLEQQAPPSQAVYNIYSPYSIYSIYSFYLFLLMCSYYPKKAYLCSDFLT